MSNEREGLPTRGSKHLDEQVAFGIFAMGDLS